MKKGASFAEMFVFSVVKTGNYFVMIVDGLGKLVTGEVSIKDLAGPVQMGKFTGIAANDGLATLIKWTAMLSLNLGIINLLPLPALDGSRLIFIGLEAVRGKPISPNKEGVVHLVGFALLMTLMLVVTYNDIRKVLNI